MTRGEIQDLVAKCAIESPRYRDALIRHPKATLEEQLNASIGPVTVKVVLETADTMYVVVPHVAGPGQLDDADLERIAGGKRDITVTCTQTGASVGNTFTQVNV